MLYITVLIITRPQYIMSSDRCNLIRGLLNDNPPQDIMSGFAIDPFLLNEPTHFIPGEVINFDELMQSPQHFRLLTATDGTIQNKIECLSDNISYQYTYSTSSLMTLKWLAPFHVDQVNISLAVGINMIEPIQYKTFMMLNMFMNTF
jgi:hypothetical protein